MFDAGLGSPNNGQPVPAPSAQDENQPWYKKAFDWTNTPTVDFVHLMGPEGAVGKAFGRTEEPKGIERGVENIVSGFTAPLSIALTLGTFGTGGLLESAGATALKEAGGEFAENLPQIMKAAKIATDAYKEGNAADPVIKAALEAGGHDLDLVRRGEQVFSPLNKLTELGSDAEQSALSKQGLSREEQAALGKGELSADARNEIAEKNGGFTDEQLKALKAAGDEAKKAQVGFTPVDDAIKAAGVDPALWNRAQKFLYDNGLTEHSLLGGDFLDRGAFQILRKTAPGWSIATTARAAETAKSIMSAGFTFQQLESASAMSPRFLDALKEGDTDKAWEYGTEMFASGTLGILGASHALHSAGELFKPLIENDAFRPNDQWLAIDRANKEREALHAEGDRQSINLDKAVREILGHTNPGFLESVFGGSKEATAQKNLELATVFHQIVTGGDRVKAAQWYNALSEALGREERLPVPGESGPNNGQDPQLAHQIDTNVFKNQPKDYQDLVMESLRRNAAGELSDREIAASKKLREEDGRNYEIGSANDLIHTFLENHLHRIYEEDNPKGKVILSNAKAGKFATNVSQARQQVYDSQLTALLKSPKKIMLDPIKAVSMDRGDLIKAAANRQLIDNLRDKFTRASDGRPAVVLSGSGQVVSGQNGEDPSIFVDPNRVRKINIDPKVIEQLSTSGDLQRYLENGTIRDITPYVRPNNIGAAIDRLEEQATKSTPAPDEHGQNPLRTQIMLLKSMQANGDFSGLKDFNDTLEKKYAWDPQDYVSLANNAMKGWNFITNSPDGTPVYVRSDIKVHPEFAEYLQNRLGLKESDISKNPVGKALLGAGTKLKQTLLSLSPFHIVQEALRGIMIGVNPIEPFEIH